MHTYLLAMLGRLLTLFGVVALVLASTLAGAHAGRMGAAGASGHDGHAGAAVMHHGAADTAVCDEGSACDAAADGLCRFVCAGLFAALGGAAEAPASAGPVLDHVAMAPSLPAGRNPGLSERPPRAGLA